VDFQAGVLYNTLLFFRDLQTTLELPRYTNSLSESYIIPSSVIHSLHPKVSRPTI
jgi:hypothetical protein